MKISNLVTFGYAEKEKIAKRELEQAQNALEKWKCAANAYDENKKCLNRTMRKIAEIFKEKDLQCKADVVSKDYADLLAANISVLTDNSSGENWLAGTAVGAAVAAGTFSLVGAFGTASTGVAISSLSGAAATTSTLAALGGGSLASGGLGMLGGVCALGGIAAAVGIPCAMTVKSYRSVKKYETTTKEIKELLNKVPSVKTIETQTEKLNTLNEKIEKLINDFNQGALSSEQLYNSVKMLIDERV